MNWIAQLDALWKPTPGQRVKTMSDEWKLARRGRLTASSRARSVAGPRAVGNFPKLRDKILAELRPDYQWVEQQFAATEWGNEHERRALSNLELHLGLDDIESYEPGFLLHPTRPYAGATPDLLIERRVGTGKFRTAVQVKCPYDADVHLKTLTTKMLHDRQYWYQLQWEGWITNATDLMFVSFDPRQRRLERQLAVLDIPVDHKVRGIFESRCDQFHDFMDGRVAPVRAVGLDSLAAEL